MKRPISPHLSIYKPQITSVLSVLHRFTGVYMFVFFVLLAFTLFICSKPNGLLSYSSIRDMSLLRYILIIGVSLFAICLSYHFYTGIRYLFWSCGIGLDINSAKRSAFAILIATILMSFTSIYMFLT
jgi:succinate dehydrogenase / fumarate reductase cytochrome b subunit